MMKAEGEGGGGQITSKGGSLLCSNLPLASGATTNAGEEYTRVEFKLRHFFPPRKPGPAVLVPPWPYQCRWPCQKAFLHTVSYQTCYVHSTLCLIILTYPFLTRVSLYSQECSSTQDHFGHDKFTPTAPPTGWGIRCTHYFGGRDYCATDFVVVFVFFFC